MNCRESDLLDSCEIIRSGSSLRGEAHHLDFSPSPWKGDGLLNSLRFGGVDKEGLLVDV